jgi:hypothetical protein
VGAVPHAVAVDFLLINGNLDQFILPGLALLLTCMQFLWNDAIVHSLHLRQAVGAA